MAVFTKLNKTQIESFINNYNLGQLNQFNEIVDGVENTNYKIICNNKPYILTIFEKRVKEEDLPFFITLKSYLNEHNFKCPLPIKNRKNNIINKIKDKNAVIISFIEGNKIDIPNPEHCIEVGKMIRKLHDLTKNFKKNRENRLGILEWKKLFKKCKKNTEHSFEIVFNDLEQEIKFIEQMWPNNLPSGIVHADLFKDNIFFKKEKISGVIDFYFSCNHFFLYDICIAINDWCFTNDGKKFEKELFNSLIKGYTFEKKLTREEIDSLNIMLRAATVRILITRLHDYIFHPKDAVVIKKDPIEYYNILKWHQKNKV